jgi:hypothetical protein
MPLLGELRQEDNTFEASLGYCETLPEKKKISPFPF